MSTATQKSRKALSELIVFFLIILIVFLLYALREEPIAMGEELKQFELKTLLTKEEKEITSLAQDSVLLDTIAEVVQDNTKTEVKQDSSSKFILFAGDSMVEQLRFRMKEIAAYNGHEMMTCIWYSSTTREWSKTDRLLDLCKEYKPEVIILTLGANELFLSNIKSQEPFIKDLLAEVEKLGIPFVWIGPPNWMDDTGLNAILEKYFGSDRFYYSGHLRDELAHLRQSDGAHPNRQGADLWADSISSWISTESCLSKKLLFERPELADFEARSYIPNDSTICRRTTRFNVRLLTKNYVPNPCSYETIADSSKIQ